MQPLSDWDEDYILNEVATIKESSSLEKKASDKLSKKSADKQDIAKEICAFANAGEGFLVFGMPDDGEIDGGVPEKIGNQSCDSWITAMVPKWHHPPIENCEARFLSASQHDSGRRVLIVRIPLSDRRPHWSTIENPHTAFLRVGEHSAPMGLQTLLDISSRGPTSFGAIKDVVMRRITTNQKGQTECRASPEVRIESGPMCAEWAFEFSIEPSAGRLNFGASMDDIPSSSTYIFFPGKETLFPQRWTQVWRREFIFYVEEDCDRNAKVKATLFIGSAMPVVQEWTIGELIALSVPA
jgi:hypothetical protein